MLVCSNMRRITTLSDNARFGPGSAVCVHLLGAVGLVVILALVALQT
jgi:Zn-dependent alcohol dehydrogenase